MTSSYFLPLVLKSWLSHVREPETPNCSGAKENFEGNVSQSYGLPDPKGNVVARGRISQPSESQRITGEEL